MHHHTTPATADTCTITATASAIADAASEPVIAAADATCHHPRPSTAGRWPPSLITAGASSTVLGVLLAARSTGGCRHRQPSAAPSRGWRWSSPYPFERRAALSPKLDRLCVRRFYVSYVDRLQQHLLLSVDWVVAARPVEDAAGGRRPAACCCCLHALMRAPHQAVILSLSL